MFFTPFWALCVAESILVCAILWYAYVSWKAARKSLRLEKWTRYLMILPISVTLFFLGSFVIGVSMLLFSGNPPALNYHNLNAAVKNTCFLDPSRARCPHTAKELINIQPQQFVHEVGNAHLTYQYYPETNDYTLIVRNNDFLFSNDGRVVVFDSRLPRTKNYGSGLDFVEPEAVQCGTTFQLINPPPFPGPWQNIQ
jgi:hypothetical protein